jgi:hypothetical protein
MMEITVGRHHFIGGPPSLQDKEKEVLLPLPGAAPLFYWSIFRFIKARSFQDFYAQ